MFSCNLNKMYLIIFILIKTSLKDLLIIKFNHEFSIIFFIM